MEKKYKKENLIYKISVWGNSRIANGYKGQCSPMRDILINELRVTSYELISLRVAFFARVTSYELILLHELRVTICIRVTSYYLLGKLRVTFCIRVTSYCLLHELRVIFIARVSSYCLLRQLRVTFFMRVKT